MSEHKTIIEIGIINKFATAAGAPVIVCGNEGETGYQVHFTFDEDWAGLEHKTARFVYVQDGAVRHQDVVFTGDTVDVPKLSNVREVHIGVFSGELCTTSPAVVACQPSILCGTGVPDEPTPDVYAQIMQKLNSLSPGGGGGLSARIAEADLTADGWTGDKSPYSQVVNIEGVTPYSQVDLTPSIEQLAIFYQKDLAFVTENENGVVTVYALGDKPQNDYTIQVTITEVSV